MTNAAGHARTHLPQPMQLTFFVFRLLSVGWLGAGMVWAFGAFQIETFNRFITHTLHPTRYPQKNTPPQKKTLTSSTKMWSRGQLASWKGFTLSALNPDSAS
jgi:hypothetical protein